LYTGFILITVLAGAKGINFALDSKFHHDFLIPWELAMAGFKAGNGKWPVFTGGNHVAYMDELLLEMRKKGITPPASNSAAAYRYTIQKLGINTPEAELFLLCLPDKMVLYGMPEDSFNRTEKLMDEIMDPKAGKFSGYRSADGSTLIGHLQIH
jgi:hypothetical protein